MDTPLQPYATRMPEARCMQGIDVAPVLDAIGRLLNNARP